MAIVKMLKIRLMVLNSQKQKILNALYKTSNVELSETKEYSDTFHVLTESDIADAVSKCERAEKAVAFYADVLRQCKKRDFYPENFSENEVIPVALDDFLSVRNGENATFMKIEKSEKYAARLTEIKSEKATLNSLINGLKLYENLPDKFTDFAPTRTSQVFFGTIGGDDAVKLLSELNEEELVSAEIPVKGQTSVICVVCAEEKTETVFLKLNERGFTKCPYSFDATAKEKITESKSAIARLERETEDIYKAVCKDAKAVKDFKLLSDYYYFETEKLRDAEKFSCTAKTFILEGYVPSDKAEEVKSAVHMASDAVFVEFSEPNKEDVVPTLVKNDKFVKQAEFVTDLYSSPDYRELDPNGAVTFFFLLLMGAIMADIGYGILMAAMGFVLARRIKTEGGAKKLWYLIAFGGIATVIFGVLFNSLFGFAVLPFNVLPSPVPDGNGIDNLMIILVGCLALGVLQIAVGYFLKAVNLFMQGDVLGGILEGLSWVTFFAGFVLACFNFLLGYLMPGVLENLDDGVKAFFDRAATPGLIMVVASLLCAAVGAAVKAKGFSKVSKFLGTFYGLISIMSDILSYARVFGLMLSGMIIAQTFNDMAVGMFSSGIIGYVFGGFIFLVGHVFNLAMGVLGAYIHVSRLQYIEFFSKFYTGEGNKFRPLGSELKYVAVNK